MPVAVMDSAGLGLTVDLVTIGISIVAVFYWISLFTRMSISRREEEGWLWIFASVLLVLLLNMTVIVLVLLSGKFQLGGGRVFYFTESGLEFVTRFMRLTTALSLSVGTYQLYSTIRKKQGAKFAFTQLAQVAEEQATTGQKFKLATGKSYMIVEGAGEDGLGCLDLFEDLIKHGLMGLCITRKYPPNIRDDYKIEKTPIVWLSKEKGFSDVLHPADLTELSHMVKDFISKGVDCVVLLDGVEYIILHNSYDEVLRLIDGLKDVVAQNSCRFIISVDPATLTEQQYHLLKRELVEFKF